MYLNFLSPGNVAHQLGSFASQGEWSSFNQLAQFIPGNIAQNVSLMASQVAWPSFNQLGQFVSPGNIAQNVSLMASQVEWPSFNQFAQLMSPGNIAQSLIRTQNPALIAATVVASTAVASALTWSFRRTLLQQQAKEEKAKALRKLGIHYDAANGINIFNEFLSNHYQENHDVSKMIQKSGHEIEFTIENNCFGLFSLPLKDKLEILMAFFEGKTLDNYDVNEITWSLRNHFETVEDRANSLRNDNSTISFAPNLATHLRSLEKVQALNYMEKMIKKENKADELKSIVKWINAQRGDVIGAHAIMEGTLTIGQMDLHFEGKLQLPLR